MNSSVYPEQQGRLILLLSKKWAGTLAAVSRARLLIQGLPKHVELLD